MLSQKTQKLLNELFYLMEQRTKIDEKIEALFSDGTSVNQPTAQWYKSEAPVESTSKHQRRKDTIVLKFTDEEMEKMIRESDEGKTAREIMREYGFQSTSDWYLLKSKYKKQHAQSTDSDDMPEFDAADDEESDDESVVEKTVAYPLAADNVPRPLPSRLRRLTQPVMSPSNRFSIPHPSRLISI